MIYGYARVSTDVQTTRMQLDALLAAGVQDVRHETGSAVGARPELRRLLADVRSGDVLVVYRLDRIARSLKDLLELIDHLKAVGCAIRSLTEPIDTSSAMGEFVLQILGAVAQLERAIIRERSFAGQVAAMRRGSKFGRDPTLTEDQRAEAVLLVAMGATHHDVASHFNVSRATIWRAMKEADGTAQPRARRVYEAATA